MKPRQPGEPLIGLFENTHIWLSDEFSVPADTLCLNRAPSPNADCFCLREVGHRGRCAFTWSPDMRGHSWKEAAA